MTLKKRPVMHTSWFEALQSEFSEEYMENLRDFLKEKQSNNEVIYPPMNKIFNCLEITPVDSVKLVILGQDPYHGIGQANGLAFSVERGMTLPPSLVNIFKEIKSDLKLEPPKHGDLSFWGRQGVLLLNSVLTVGKGSPGSHAGQGWEIFTDEIIKVLNRKENLVFLLWGNYAQKKGLNIDSKIHKVLKAPHPSPLSAHKGFFGCKHFSQANAYLENNGKLPILWTEEN